MQNISSIIKVVLPPAPQRCQQCGAENSGRLSVICNRCAGGESAKQEKTYSCLYCRDKKFVYLPLPADGRHSQDLGKAWPCPRCSMVPDGAGGFQLYANTSKGQKQLALMRSVGCEI